MKIVVLLALSLFFRFLYLGVIPVSLAHDETDLIIQAHSLIQTGSDIVGDYHPLRFLPNSGVMGELAPLINAPALRVLPNTLFTAHFTTALLSSLFPLLIWYWLTLIGVKRTVGITSALLLAVSPWHILFSRTTLEQPTSLFFYLLSWIALARIKDAKSLRPYLMNLLLFTLTYSFGFYTYHGYKFALPLLTGILMIYHTITSPKWSLWKQFVFPALVVTLLFARVLIYSDHYGSRSGELLLLNTAQFDTSVNADRRMSLAPEGLKTIFSNKPLKLVQAIRDKYIAALSPDLLFVHGEGSGVFSTWQTGYLYLLSLPFLIVGLGYLILNHQRVHLLMLTLLVLSPLATVMHVNNSLAFRSGIYFVLLNIVVAYGVVEVMRLLSRLNLHARWFIYICLGLIVSSSLAYFSYIYFYVTPVTNAKSYFFSDRLIGEYVRRSEGRILVIDSQPRYVYASTVLADHLLDRDAILSFNGQYSPSDQDTYKTPNLTVAKKCPPGEVFDTVIVSVNLLPDLGTCDALTPLQQLPSSSIVSPADSGETYKIFGDKLCESVDLRSYVHPTRIEDFDLPELSLSDFCVKWIVKQ